jgi:hypothetical protein
MSAIDRILMGAAVVVSVASPANAQTILSTTGGGTPISPFGKPDAQTFGQTFTAPLDNVFQNFTFYLGPAGSLVFRAYVYAWDVGATRATGPALFTSNPIIGPIGFGGFFPVTATLGGLVLNPGGAYVAFFSSSGQGTIGEIALQDAWDSPAANQYAGGAFVYLNNGENTGAFTTQQWSTDRQGPGSDVRFTMSFTPVPEPQTWALMLTGLVSIGGIGLARRRKGRSAFFH